MDLSCGKYNPEQKAWCKKYQKETGFEPLMDVFEAGNETFHHAAQKSIQWFECWSSETLLRISAGYPHDL